MGKFIHEGVNAPFPLKFSSPLKTIYILIATIIGLIAVATLATISGIALKEAIQTKKFVKSWHKDSGKFKPILIKKFVEKFKLSIKSFIG